jgi:uracil-DNA glycosylase
VSASPTRTLDVLLADIRRCQLCAPSLELGPRPVVQVSADAKILIVGQAPGRRVHESGVPFDDPSGDRLRAWLGLDRFQFYDPALVAIVPMGFCYPGTGSSGDLPPRPECAPAWRAELLSHLTNVEMTIVIGSYAQAYHLPESPRAVTDVVAAWRDHWPTVVPLPHPSPRNNRWLVRNPWFTSDVLPALQARVAEMLRAAG